MTEYREIFKCRLCGETYEAGCTGSEDIAFQSVLALSIGIKRPCPQSPQIISVHCCNGGSFGIADFQGFRKVDSEA